MSAADDMSNCAACGKGGDDLKTCNACKMVKYCNATCQKAHRPMHKKECKKRAAELFDEALFKEPPPKDECPICCVSLPLTNAGSIYKVCCGKILCIGCAHGVDQVDNRALCPFCRTPAAKSDEEYNERIKKRVDDHDPIAIHQLGCLYRDGNGLTQDYDKALELLLQAGELGCTPAYYSVGNAYYNGISVERDMKKATYYYELAAMGGDAISRHNLGVFEYNAGNKNRAVKHFMIGAGAGFDNSLREIRKCFMAGYATKDDFERALRANKEAKDEMKSDQREAAAAFYCGRQN